MDVVVRREERVQLAGPQRPPLDERELVAVARVDLLILLSAIETDETPGEVVVHGRRRAGGDASAKRESDSSAAR